MGVFRKKKTQDPKAGLVLGADVEYLSGEEWVAGKIHAISEVDQDNGSTRVVAYLVDTGETHLEDTIITEEGEDNIEVSQPVQVSVAPENIRLVK